MAQDDISYWLVKRGQNVGLEAAKKLAAQSRLGWYIAPRIGKKYSVGKITAGEKSKRQFLMDDAGKVLTFDSVEDARKFLREELNISVAQVFEI
ncbi:MAG: hypothetical protein FJY54_10935 [Betaproteobacteria bacterium]|nr:hypothetical protein [Betaproteobacteria bacterium]